MIEFFQLKLYIINLDNAHLEKKRMTSVDLIDELIDCCCGCLYI